MGSQHLRTSLAAVVLLAWTLIAPATSAEPPSGAQGSFVVVDLDTSESAGADQQALRRAMPQMIEVLRRRLDPDETAGVTFTPRGNSLTIYAPSIPTPAELVRRVGPVARLTLNLVDDNISTEDYSAGRVPPNDMFAQPYPGAGSRAEAVRREVLLSGAHVVRADPSVDTLSGTSVVSFSLDDYAADVFCKLSSENIGKRFAILLDDQVVTAPMIQEPICGGGGQIAGDFSPESANEMARLLRSGALPATLRVVRQGNGRPPEH